MFLSFPFLRPRISYVTVSFLLATSFCSTKFRNYTSSSVLFDSGSLVVGQYSLDYFVSRYPHRRLHVVFNHVLGNGLAKPVERDGEQA